MKNKKLDRKKFLSSIGKIGLCACACSAIGSLEKIYAKGSQTQDTKEPKSERPFRTEFINKWTPRFFSVFANVVDKRTAKKVMMENGKACYDAWIKETNQKLKPVNFEKWKEWVKKNNKEEGFKIEGNTIYYQYNGAAETGATSKEGQCLCPLVEDKPTGLNPIYCNCSIGYVRQQHQLLFADKKVEVELLDSVLRGGKRCKFKITVS
jgi:hypothetical protein